MMIPNTLCSFMGLVCLAGSFPLVWESEANPEYGEYFEVPLVPDFEAHPEYGEHFEGDILLTPEEIKSGVSDEASRWPRQTLLYNLGPGFTGKELEGLQKAMDEISSKTCIRFTTATSGDYVHIQNTNSSCSSYVGRKGGKQILNLVPACFYGGHGTVMHELIHALGFYHEHTRPDRDDYVEIVEDMILPNHISNFYKHDDSIQYTPYDYGSIMHYWDTAFAKVSGGITIKVKQSGAQIGQRLQVSSLDAEKINRMYNC